MWQIREKIDKIKFDLLNKLFTGESTSASLRKRLIVEEAFSRIEEIFVEKEQTHVKDCEDIVHRFSVID